MSEQNQFVEGLHRMVERMVQERLPEGYRGLRARRVLAKLIEPACADALQNLVAELAAKVEDTLGVPVIESDAPSLSGRLTVIDNDKPCGCGRVTPLAVVTLVRGQPTAVECDRCAPEYRGR